MKIINYIKACLFVFLLASGLGLISSCEEDEDVVSEVVIHQVTHHNSTTTTEVITSARPGTIIRLDGSGLSSTRAVYINGVKISVSPSYVTDTNIILTIPSTMPYGSDVEDEAVRNTIRIVTANGEYTYPFLIQGPNPVISGVSHSLPREGEELKIYGANLRDIETITFPGDIILNKGQFVENNSFTTITCIVPSGATATPGSIHIVGANGEAYSYNYMNRSDCVFIKNFSSDPNVAPYGVRAYDYGTNISATNNALLPQGGNDHKNPDAYRQIPVNPSTIGVEQNVGGFNFRPHVGLASVLNTSNGAVTESTPSSALALQFDIYLTGVWESGWIRIDFIDGNTAWRYNYAPWVVSGGERNPIVMTGWRTVTVPLSAISALSGKTYKNFIDETTGKAGKFSFINGTYTDASGTRYAPNPIPDFQLSFGNFRIVPYVKE